jgi:hypothetical protein
VRERTMRRRSMTAALAIAVWAAVLAGCTGSTPSIEATAARQLQSSVVAIAQSAAAGNASQALARLDELSTAVQASTASGAITSERAAVIRAAIAKVHADLTAAIRSTPPTVTPSPGSSDSSSDSDSSSTPSSTPAPTTGGGEDGGASDGGDTPGGSTPPPATSPSSPSDSPTEAPTDPPPTTESTAGP